MSGMYRYWYVVFDSSAFGDLIKRIISFRNISSILKDYLKNIFQLFTFPLKSISDFEMSRMFEMFLFFLFYFIFFFFSFLVCHS